jgi:hypothetical protein
VYKALLPAVMLVLAVAAQAKAPENGADYHSIVPSDWKLLPEDASSHERRFVSPSGDAWLTLYAQPADREPIQAHIAQVRRHENERITYEREEQTWIVVSGYNGDRIFYRKAMLACGGQVWHHLAFEYPATQKRAFDDVVTRASYALQAYGQVGCSR